MGVQNWDRLGLYRYGDDEYGILDYFGHEPTPADMAYCFEGTHAGAWGNILMGKPAGGIYGDIISGIERYGFKGFIGDGDDWKSRTKNKASRHLRIGRRARKRANIKKMRLPYVEPFF